MQLHLPVLRVFLMREFTPRNFKTGPEAKIQASIIRKLESLGWFVKETHGNMYQSGFPDLYAAHRRYGARWIEVKFREQYHFTPAQIETFPKMSAAGVGIWILTSDTETDLLMGPANWHTFLGVMK